MAGSEAYPSVKAELIADIQRIHRIHKSISRSLYRKYGGFSERKIRNYFGTFRHALVAAGLLQSTSSTAPQKPASAPVAAPQSHLTESNEIVGDTWNVTLPKTRISTLEELLNYCKVDLSVWRVERFLVNKWEVGAKDANDNVNVTPLFQIKATLVRQKSVVDAKAEIESLKKAAEILALTPTPIVRGTRTASGNMLELALFDAHFGKLAWPRETGGEPYDTRLAQKTYLETVEHLIEPTLNYKVDSILFVVGNDLIHSDDTEGRTTKGTYVDCDTRYYKTFEIVRETITKVIERLREIAPVTVKMVQGNHDTLSVWHLGDSLTALFRNYDDVVIDNEPTYHKYHQWGEVGLMFTHGDKGKRTDYPLLFATDRPLIFGNTKFREVHTGHFHKTQMEEYHGVRVRIIPSLSPADAWHAENGFTGQLRTGEAYVWNRDRGLVAQFYHNAGV